MNKNQRRLFLAGVAVIVAALFSSRVVPIYDGVGFPDEPYRYVSPASAKQKTAQAPTDAAGLFKPVDFAGGGTYGAYISSGESGPQVVLSLGQGSLIIPANTKTIDIRVQPLAPTNEPKDGQIAGDVYKLTITGDAGKVQVSPGNNNIVKYINLRLPQGFPAYPTMEYQAVGGKWQDLMTNRVGNDIYAANVKGEGDYALAETNAGLSAPVHRPIAEIVIGGLSLLVGMLLIVLFIRHQSKQTKTNDRPGQTT